MPSNEVSTSMPTRRALREVARRDLIHLIVAVRRRVVIEHEPAHLRLGADLERLIGRRVAVVREPRVLLGQEVRVVDDGVDARRAGATSASRIAPSATRSSSVSGSGPVRKCCLCSTWSNGAVSATYAHDEPSPSMR